MLIKAGAATNNTVVYQLCTKKYHYENSYYKAERQQHILFRAKHRGIRSPAKCSTCQLHSRSTSPLTLRPASSTSANLTRTPSPLIIYTK